MGREVKQHFSQVAVFQSSLKICPHKWLSLVHLVSSWIVLCYFSFLSPSIANPFVQWKAYSFVKHTSEILLHTHHVGIFLWYLGLPDQSSSLSLHLAIFAVHLPFLVWTP